MRVPDLIEATGYYALVVTILNGIYQYGKVFNSKKLNNISAMFPTLLLSFGSFFMILLMPFNFSNEMLIQGVFVFIIILFLVLSCYMMYRKLFTYITSYQVVCFVAYLLFIEIFGFDYLHKIVLYSSILFSLGLIILIRFGNVTSPASGNK